jgi:hypothetical protein
MAVRKSSAGGAALQGGAAYQNRVAAWLAVGMLAESEAAPLSPGGGSIEILRAETQESMDDLLVGTSLERYTFLQVKRRISLSPKKDSELASVLDQVVRQIAGSGSGNGGKRPWSRPLDPAKDRLVLVTSSDSSQEIRESLRNLLIRVTNLAPHQPLDDAAVNNRERRALRVAVSHVERSWQAATGLPAIDRDVGLALSLFFVEILDVETDQVHEREAKRTLDSVVLEDRAQVGVAWSNTIIACTEMAQARSGLDRSSLQKKLQDAGIALRALPSYRRDIDRLRKHTEQTIRLLTDLSQIRIDGKAVHIERSVISELRDSAEKASHIIVGVPGAGKSGALHDLAQALNQSGADVVCLATDRLEIASLYALRSEIGLDHDIADVLRNWHGLQPSYLLIDALDAARGDHADAAMLSLIRQISEPGGRWKVVASIRKFDLRYSLDLQHIFRVNAPASLSSAFLDPEFSLVRHVNVPIFSIEEMATFHSSAPALHALYANASEGFSQLLRVPFNLRLAADLLESGVRSEELAPLRTQYELLERYWHRRVLDGQGGDDREAILRRAVQGMVQDRNLKVERMRALGPGSTTALEQLLSAHVLAEWQPSPTTRPDRYLLAFSHNLLFDFAVSRLYLPPQAEDLLKMLATDRDLVLVIRPSLVFRFQELWERNREEFWELALLFANSPMLSQLAQAIPLAVVAESAETLEDLQPFVSALDQQQEGSERCFKHLVGALTSGRQANRPLVGLSAGPWSALLERVTRQMTPERSAYAQILAEALLNSEVE